MLKTKHFIEKYYSYYAGFIICLWMSTLFLSWNTELGGIAVYPLLLQKIFPVLGISLIVISVMLKKVSLFVLGIGAIFAFWINMFILFAILPGFVGN